MARSVLTQAGSGGRRSRRGRRGPQRRRRLRMIALAGAAALVVAAVVLVVSSSGGGAQRRVVTSYVSDWARGDYPGMYSLLDPASRARISESHFAASYRRAAQVATVVALTPRRVGAERSGVIPVPMLVRTRLWGTLHETLDVPLSGSSSSPTVRYTSALLFPGLRAGERLTRKMALPPRASLLAADGTPLAEGPDRTSPIPDVALQIVGVLGPIPADQAARYAAAGYPPKAQVGLDGLERVFEPQLAGTPGGALLAGKRELAQVAPKPGHAVKTTIEPALENAAVAALGGNYAGIVAMDPRTGALEAVAGIAYSAPQPPGSTMKIITSTGALQAGIVKLTDTFPIATSATLDGYTLHNAGDEACGGTLLNAFAVSCNSVFAPLGARLGGAKLVATAERFGFNQPTGIAGAAESRIPPADQIGDDLAVGSSAIGQGKVEATPLQMTDVAATIAMGGRRPVPTLAADQPARFVPVTSPQVAALVQRMMIAVVQFGTGTAAQIPGVTVAGKTGTAELVSTSSASGQSTGTASDTDAWFVGYAPVGAPRIVVGALFPNQGAGGGIAAPAVRQVLVAALQAH